MKTVSYELASELLEALKRTEDFLCGPTAWTQEQEDSLVEKVSCAIAKAEAEMVDGKPDANKSLEWIEWSGGECPVSGETLVEVVLRNGEDEKEQAGECFWRHGLGDGDIIAYRVVGEPK